MHKTFNTPFKSLVCLCLAAMSNFAFAADCDANFETKGNILVGQSYQTNAYLPGVTEASALQAVQQAMVLDSWKINNVDSAKKMITASNPNIKRDANLIAMVAKTDGGALIVMRYNNPAGAISPEDAVKAQFCKLATAAGSVALPALPALPQATRPVFTGNPNLALMSDQQAEKLDAALAKPIADQKMSAMATEAKPIIKEVIGRLACIKSFDTSTFPRYVVPSCNGHMTHGPGNNTSYHNKTLCLTVEKFQAWTPLALNAFQFGVIYGADDSGESVSKTYKLRKQPDGEWLFEGV